MNNNQIKGELATEISERVAEAYEMFLEENSISHNMIQNQSVVDPITDEQTDLCFDEFMEEAEEVSEDEIQDKIRNYVTNTFNYDFLIMKVEQELDIEQILEDLREELVLFLINTEPYGHAPREYWYNQSQKVQEIKELADYADTDGVHLFVETYAPDWEEEVEEV